MYLLEKVLIPAEKNSSNRISSDLSQRAILYGTNLRCRGTRFGDAGPLRL